VATPPQEWKRRVAANVPLGEMPLRTVKTILHELVTVRGAETLNHLTRIPDADKRCGGAASVDSCGDLRETHPFRLSLRVWRVRPPATSSRT